MIGIKIRLFQSSAGFSCILIDLSAKPEAKEKKNVENESKNQISIEIKIVDCI